VRTAWATPAGRETWSGRGGRDGRAAGRCGDGRSTARRPGGTPRNRSSRTRSWAGRREHRPWRHRTTVAPRL
ncbi:MAG: hypothetical protein AVDCRST_MAG49-1016, partial [uncultured Thermomicrobiales bacterium]